MERMRYGRRIKQGLTVLCIAVFLYGYVDSTMFWHGHNISGNWVFHSHISTKAHRSAPLERSHTEAELLLISAVNAVSYTEEALAAFDFTPLRPFAGTLAAPAETDAASVKPPHAALRGPPALV